MYHILYKSYLPSGKYYVGRHSTENLNDGYIGSGRWPRSLTRDVKKQLITTVLSHHDTYDELLLKEAELLKSVIDDPLCMNYTTSAIGGKKGQKLNISEEERERRRNRARYDNPMKNGHTLEAKTKISEAMKGSNNPFHGKHHTEKSRSMMSVKRSSFRYTDEQKQCISVKRKEDYLSGKRKPLNWWIGKKLPNDMADAIRNSEYNRNRPKSSCKICGRQISVNAIKRHEESCKRGSFAS